MTDAQPIAQSTPPTTPEPQRITIEVLNKQEPKAEETPPETARKDTGIDYKYNTEYHRFCDDLGVDKYKRDDARVAQKVALIYDWAKEQTETEDGGKISVAIRDLTRTLGVQNTQGELLVDHLFRWIRVDMDGERVRMQEKTKELVEKELQIKQQITAIEPKISNEELETRVKLGMKDIQKQIKRRVKSQVTAAINRGIREAIGRQVQSYGK